MLPMPRSVLLEPSSLYISTTQLTESKFHWALIATDADCTAIRHHWHEQPDTKPGCAEGYGFQRIQPKSLTGRVVLGYYKIVGYATPPAHVFYDICSSTFASSFATVHENRRNGITCRTWVMEVLAALCADGHITGYMGGIDNFVSSLERVVTEQSRKADNAYLTTFYRHRTLTFVSMVMAV